MSLKKRAVELAWLCVLPLYVVAYIIDGARIGFRVWLTDGRTFWRRIRDRRGTPTSSEVSP